MLANFSKAVRRQFRPLQSGGWGRAIGYTVWTGVSVAGLGSLLTVGVVMLWYAFVGDPAAFLTSPAGTMLLYGAQYFVRLAVLLIVPVFFVRHALPSLRRLFGVARAVRWADVWAALAVVLPYFAASFALQWLVMVLVPAFDPEQVQEIGFENLTGAGELLVAGLALVVFAPVAEELIFRGYLFGGLRENVRFWPAAIITSILFGALHGQWNVALDTFVLSLILCYLREKTGSIWAGMVLHGIKNALAFTLLFLWPLG